MASVSEMTSLAHLALRDADNLSDVNSADREFHFTSMLTVHLSIQLPPNIKLSD